MPYLEHRLAELKEKYSVTNQEIANHLNVKIRAVQFYCKGERRPDYDGLISLADFFDVSLDYLVGRSDDPHRH